MMKEIILSCVLSVCIFDVFSQNNRLALVIGNADYEVGALKNPVNDALLMAQTLENLEFDVILDTNTIDRGALMNSIKEFGNKRIDYEVGFVYYAGHGVQVDNINYLLPTKVKFETEYDVSDNAVSVQTIMRYLTNRTDQVNILILDACRNNPFEGNWNMTRSLEGGGLAKMKAPTGSLIAFSTTAGETAPDGKGDNSIYTLSLVNNMIKEGISLDQVFRNVRAEVLEETNGQQQTEESTQLTGETFYLVKTNFENTFEVIDSLFNVGNYIEGLRYVNTVLNKEPKNSRALLWRGDLYLELKKTDEAFADYSLAISIDEKNPKNFNYRGYAYNELNNYNLSIIDFSNCIKIDSTYSNCYSNRADAYFALEDYENALNDYSKAIELQPEDPDYLIDRSECYVALENYDNALIDVSKAIEVSSAENKAIYLNNRADFYRNNDELELALIDYASVIEVSKVDNYSKARAINNRALIFRDQGNYEKAINEQTYLIDNYSDVLNEQNLAISYDNRAYAYFVLEDYENALNDYSKAIELQPEDPDYLIDRSDCYVALEDYDNALIDMSKAIDVAMDKETYFTIRADFYDTYLDNSEKSLEDYDKAISLSPEFKWPLNNKAYLLLNLERYEEALKIYDDIIEIDSTYWRAYSNKADIYFNLEDYENALNDYSKVIDLQPEDPDNFIDRSKCYVALEDYDNALIDVSKAIEVSSAENKAIYLNNRADFYRNNDELELALIDYAAVLEFSKVNTYSKFRAINNRAVVFEDKGNYDMAINEYTYVIDNFSDILNEQNLALSYANRADAYFVLEDYENALNDYSKVIRLQPEDPDNFIDRSDCYVALEDYDNALIDMSKAIDVAMDKETYFTIRADFYDTYLDNSEKSLEDYDKAISLSPEFKRPLNNKAYLLLNLERYEEALKIYDDIIEIDSTYWRAYSNKADIYYNLEDYNRAIYFYKKTLHIEENINDIVSTANCFLELKDTSSAITFIDSIFVDTDLDSILIHESRFEFYVDYLKDYERALLEINNILLLDSSSENYAKRGMIYTLKNDFELALLDFEKSIQLDTENRTPYYFRAKMYEIQKKYEEQRNDLLFTIEMDPEDPEGYYYLALSYFTSQNYFRCLHYLDQSIEKLDANLGYYISDENGFSEVNLYKLYQKKAEVYKIVNLKDLACHEYENACEYGNCEYYNSYCK